MSQLNSQKLRVGIPRGLFYYRDFPFWNTFFTVLGAEVLVSPETNSKILEEGTACLTDDVCLPVKTFCGHAVSLAKNCDFIFIPSIYSLEKRVYSCSKTIGLPDLIRSVAPNIPKILDLDINLEKGKKNFNQNLYKMAWDFTADKRKIGDAIKKAEKAQENFDSSVKEEGVFLEHALTKLFQSQDEKIKKYLEPDTTKKPIEKKYRAKVGLVGYPYLIYDKYLNHQLIDRLEDMGVKVFFVEQIPKKELRKSLLKLTDRPYWTSEEDIAGAGGYFLEKENIDGIICVSAFGCGPDSLIIELLKQKAKEKRKILLHLSLDEHTAEAGFITRLEAFIDSLGQRGQNHYSLEPIKPIKSPQKVRILGVPNMGDKLSVFTEAFKDKFGIILLSPPVTQRTISLGAKHSPEDVCIPFKATLGSFIECLEQGADSLMMITSFNACRFGYYSKIQEKILQDIGYQFRFLRFHSKDRGIRGGLSLIRRLTNNASWMSIVSFSFSAIVRIRISDEIERCVQRIRPFEIKKGQADNIYRESFQAINKAGSIFSLKRVRKEYLERLGKIPKNTGLKPLKVGIIGELYVTAEPFVNMDLEKELGQRGVLVERPKSTFFSEYARPFHFNPLNQEKKRLKGLTSPYSKRDFGGHGLESLGLKIEYARKRYDGIVHLMPFTCMPEIIAQNIMVSTREKIPVLTVVCDEEMGRAGLITRVEAFVDLLQGKSKT